MSLSQKLLSLRKERGWTQAQAAKEISIQQSYLSKLENGHFVPSDDVIEKLSKAYRIKPEQLETQSTKRGFPLVFTIIIPLLGLFLLISGATDLLFSSTYYTYKTEPLASEEVPQLYLNYHLSDEYLGERLVSDKSGVKYQFTLIATRDIDRQENRIQLIAGLSLILLSIGLYSKKFLEYKSIRKEKPE